MASIKTSSHGIVVDHVESGVRYAISDKNYDPKINRKVRDLKPGETVLGFRPLRREALGGETVATGATTTSEGAENALSESSEGLTDQSAGATQTEGASTGASLEKKKGN
jgi:hypothetical protein